MNQSDCRASYIIAGFSAPNFVYGKRKEEKKKRKISKKMLVCQVHYFSGSCFSMNEKHLKVKKEMLRS